MVYFFEIYDLIVLLPILEEKDSNTNLQNMIVRTVKKTMKEELEKVCYFFFFSF